jgi:ParB/RepB/Spo0J family partition protein
MSRRDHIKNLYESTAESEKLAMANSPKPPAHPAGDRLSAGPVRTMGLTLDRMEQERRALEEALATGAKVVELDPALIEPSLILDRFANPNDPKFESFKRLVEENGQEVPILVRPHPDKTDRFQIAYGNRRRRACLELGRKVRAIVREMTDAELVTSQGLENSGRENLSYIERAFYAARLEDRGFERTVIMTALNTDKGELSKLISVARAVPERIAKQAKPPLACAPCNVLAKTPTSPTSKLISGLSGCWQQLHRDRKPRPKSPPGRVQPDRHRPSSRAARRPSISPSFRAQSPNSQSLSPPGLMTCMQAFRRKRTKA